MRSLGNNCHTLTHLDISHAKLVSDVGLASISNGCPQLTHLYLHALYLLADPKLGAPKKGEKAEAWQSVVGTAALAKFAPLLENLNISGCFRLNVSIKRHISTFKHLKILNMSGCNQVSKESMVSLTIGCPLLEEVNFSDCGKYINNAVMISMAEHCKNVRILTLNRLDGIKGQAVKAISNFDKLERLELSGCRSITDLIFSILVINLSP